LHLFVSGLLPCIIAKDFEPEFLLASGHLDGVHDQIWHANWIQIEFIHDFTQFLGSDAGGGAEPEQLGVTFRLFPEDVTLIHVILERCAKASKFLPEIWSGETNVSHYLKHRLTPDPSPELFRCIFGDVMQYARQHHELHGIVFNVMDTRPNTSTRRWLGRDWIPPLIDCCFFMTVQALVNVLVTLTPRFFSGIYHETLWKLNECI